MAPLCALCLVAPLAGGCAPLGLELGIGTETSPPKESRSRRPDPAEMRLAEAAERAEAALTALAMMRAADSPGPVANVPADRPRISPVPPELRRAVTIDWIGPVETLAEALARRAGYRFIVAGAPSVRPVMVSVTARNLPLIEVLRDTGLQAGNAATLAVDAGKRTVRLDWIGEDRGAEVRREAEHGFDTAAGSGGS